MRVRGQRARRGRRSGVSSESSDSRRRRESKEKTPSPVPRAESPGRLEDQPIAGPSSAFDIAKYLSSSRAGIGYTRDDFEAVRGEEEMENQERDPFTTDRFQAGLSIVTPEGVARLWADFLDKKISLADARVAVGNLESGELDE